MLKSMAAKIREHALAFGVFVAGCLLTVALCALQQAEAREERMRQASSDAAHFQRTLQRGIDSYLHLSDALAGFFSAPQLPSAREVAAYLRSIHALKDHVGLSYIGYVPRVPRAGAQSFEAASRAELPGFSLRGPGADPDYIYPYLYAFPADAVSTGSRGLDFSGIAPRWAAMQEARDSGNSTATARHRYVAAGGSTGIMLVFTPVYDLKLPLETVEQRRVALRGFVHSIYEIDQMIDGVLGNAFQRMFDLEIFDGTVSRENIVYDPDSKAQTLAGNGPEAAHNALVEIGGRHWHLYFYPTPAYLEPMGKWDGILLFALGLTASAALARASHGWQQLRRTRLQQRDQASRFEAVFERHPSAVYALDLQRRFVNANARALRELKITKENLIGKSVDAFIVPERRERAAERFRETVLGNSVSYESAIIDGAGERVDISVIMIPVKSGNQVTSVLGIAENITAQKAAEWRLKESRRMLQLVINHIPQRVFWKNTRLEYLGCNEAFSRDAGLESPADIVGKTDYDLAWHANAELYRKDDIETLTTNRPKLNYEEVQNLDDGSERWLTTSKIPLSDMDGNTVALLGVYEDITVRRQMEEQLREMAHFDALTGLANRAFFHHQLGLATASARRHGKLLALMYFDIDRFKPVNDTHGHEAGDALLMAFAARIAATVRENDVVARLGGDEFVLLLDDIPNRESARNVAAKLVEAMHAPFAAGGTSLAVSTSIGVAFYRHGESPDDLIQRADLAMYSAKRDGGDRFVIAPG